MESIVNKGWPEWAAIGICGWVMMGTAWGYAPHSVVASVCFAISIFYVVIGLIFVLPHTEYRKRIWRIIKKSPWINIGVDISLISLVVIWLVPKDICEYISVIMLMLGWLFVVLQFTQPTKEN